MAILALALLAFGLGTILASQARLAGDIDRELRDTAKRTFRPGPPRGRFPDDGLGPIIGRYGPGQPPDGLDSDGFRLGELRRPRQFGLDGRSLSEPGDTPIDPKAIGEAQQGRPTYSDGNFEEEPVRLYTEPCSDRRETTPYQLQTCL